MASVTRFIITHGIASEKIACNKFLATHFYHHFEQLLFESDLKSVLVIRFWITTKFDFTITIITAAFTAIIYKHTGTRIRQTILKITNNYK